jgi:4-amino-4-deoxy-L-arabinose transferase-like glycosyltransferase
MGERSWILALLFAAAAAVFFVGNGRTSLFDRDEPRYAQCSRQMLDSGDWVVPRLYDRIRAAKPPGIYWCQAAAMKLFGENAFAARLPSVVATLLAMAVLGFALFHEVGPRRTVWTLFIFSTSTLVIYASKMAMTDAVLLFFTLIAFVSIYLLWRGRGGWGAVVAVSVSIAFGGLIKGPFILGVLAATLAVLGLLWAVDRRRESAPGFPLDDRYDPGLDLVGAKVIPIRPGMAILKTGVGLAIVVALVLPWLVMIRYREPIFLSAATQDAREHLEKGSEGHTGYPGFHLLVIWGTYLPWSLLLPLAIGMGIANRRDPLVRFALASVLGSWVFAEILKTKLPHYMLPAMPGLAFLTADAVVRSLDGETDALTSRGIRIGAGVIGVVIVGLATVPWWWLAISFHSFQWVPLIGLAVVGIGFGFSVWFFFHTRRPLAGLISMGVGALALGAMLFGVYFPQSQPLRLSIRAADILRSHGVTEPGQALMLDYKEPSLAFYQGGTIREAKHSMPVVEDIDSAPPWMVMTREVWDHAPPGARDRMEIVGEPLRGYNYSDSLRPVELLVVKKR